ncbi:MAG: preprotein translocase subunit SecG [Campylobacterales bacterium]|nr:preprotein translocase subunit SecG [Campylobacterales bacterium]
MSQVLLILQFVLAIVITISVLLQKSSSIGLGAYSGSNESLFGAKGNAGFLTKFTYIVGFIFVINTIVLGYTYNKEYNLSLVDSIKIEQSHKNIPQAPVAPTTTNEAPQAPKN